MAHNHFSFGLPLHDGPTDERLIQADQISLSPGKHYPVRPLCLSVAFQPNTESIAAFEARS